MKRSHNLLLTAAVIAIFVTMIVFDAIVAQRVMMPPQ